jgi:hypothetical protein
VHIHHHGPRFHGRGGMHHFGRMHKHMHGHRHHFCARGDPAQENPAEVERTDLNGVSSCHSSRKLDSISVRTILRFYATTCAIAVNQ